MWQSFVSFEWLWPITSNQRQGLKVSDGPMTSEQRRDYRTRDGPMTSEQRRGLSVGGATLCAAIYALPQVLLWRQQALYSSWGFAA